VMGDDTEDDDGTFVSEYWWLIGVLLIGVIGIVAIIFVVQNRESEEGNELKEETGCQDDESSENHQRTSSSQNN